MRSANCSARTWRRPPPDGWNTNIGKVLIIGSMSNSFWKNRAAFVTGATGFVGAHVARTLVEGGARVVCLQRDSVRANSLDLFGLRNSVNIINGSVEDYPLMERILTEYEVEAVFHLAAQAIVGAANRSPLSTF